AISASLSPNGVAVDMAGNLFIATSGRIRKVSPSGIISTVAGGGFGGFGGDGGPATSAHLGFVESVAVDTAGNLLIADYDYGRIRRVDLSGIISTLAGMGNGGFSGDGGPATSALMIGPLDVSTDQSGNLFIADSQNNRIRKLTPVTESRTFSIRDRGGVSLKTSGTETAVMTGYASIQPNIGLPTPSGVAIVGFRQNNVLVSEASTPASSLIRAGRIYAEIDGP